MTWLGMQTGTSIQLGFHFSRRQMSTLLASVITPTAPKRKASKEKLISSRTRRQVTRKCSPPGFPWSWRGSMDRQLSDYTNITLKLEVLQRPVFSYQCPSPQGLTLTRHYSQYGESIVGQTLFEVPSFVNEIKIRRK